MARTKKRVCGECPECNLGPKTFCFWQMEKAVPEHFKPSLIGAYISIEDINGLGYLQPSEIKKPFDPEFLSWFLSFCIGHRINVFWKVNDVPFCLGSPEFIETMTRFIHENGA